MEQARRTGARRRQVLGALGALGALGLAARGRSPWGASGPIGHEAYVWQRSWGEAVQRAVAGAGADFRGLVALGAEVSGAGPAVDVRFAGEALRRAGGPVGLAVRVQGQAGEAEGRAAAEAIARMLRRAGEQGVAVGEIQIDLDSAASRLDAYRAWLDRLRPAVGGRALTATALPSWLHRPSFAALAGALDGYVLQVHGLERPGAGRAALFDPEAARRAVALAGALGRPFRLALPTYRYEVAFDAAGRAVGLEAEGAAGEWGDEVRVERVEARPAAVAALVRSLERARPRALAGVLWYRLPVEGDRHNWALATLRAVQRGSEPAARLGARVERDGGGAWSVSVRNEGDDSAGETPAVRVSWPASARRVAHDGLGGASAQRVEERALVLRPGAGAGLRPGEERAVGWVRLEGEGAPGARLEEAP